VGVQRGAPPHQPPAAAEQVAPAAAVGGVGVRQRRQAAQRQPRDLLGADLVALGLAAVDAAHGQGVAQGERDGRGAAEVGQPVPGARAPAGDHDVGAERRQGAEEALRVGGQVPVQQDAAPAVQDASVHRLGVPVDAAVECGTRTVETQMAPFGERSGRAGWLQLQRTTPL